MAQKRMFSLQVVDTDAFLDMPVSAQALYFHLGMHGEAGKKIGVRPDAAGSPEKAGPGCGRD